MRSQNFVINLQSLSLTDEKIRSFLRAKSFKSVLVQVFSGELDKTQIQKVVVYLSGLLPKESVIAGATTSGEILEGIMLEHQVVVSISLFDNTQIVAAHSDQFNSFDELGAQLAKSVCSADTKAVILFIDGLLINGEAVTKSFSQHAINRPVLAGGMAGDYSNFQQTWIIHNQEVFNNGAVAVALNSKTLRAFNSFNLSWTSLGPKMKITKSSGGRVYEIDHTPIIEVYKKYLGEEVIANMPDSTIEFPLVIQNQAIPVARSMVHVFDDQSVLFAGNLDEATEVRFAIANARELEKSQQKMRDELLSKDAESCFIYSCAARKAFLGKQLEQEFLPIAELMPVAGFFTYGEVYHFNKDEAGCLDNDTLLNVTTTLLGLSESKIDNKAQTLPKTEATNPKQNRQNLSQTALINLVNETTKYLNQELDENNKLMQFFNQYQMAINEFFIVSKSDIHGTITFANQTFQKISGFTTEELIGKNHNIVRHPDNPVSLFKEMWETILSKKIWQGVIKNRAKNGQDYIVRTSIVPILDRFGEISEFLSLREDVTEQETQKSILENEKSKMLSILNNQSSLVIMTNTKKNEIEIGNKAFLDYSGYDSIASFKANHKCVCDLFKPLEGFLQKSMDGVPWYDYVMQNADKEHVVMITSHQGIDHLFSVSLSPLADEPNHIIANFNDITVLEKERVRAIQAEKAQSQFLANMSHELRTPINGILGFADLLEDTRLDNEQQRYVDILRSSSRHLLSVVNDILDISKIERGEIELHPQEEQVFVDLEKILISFSPVAEKKGVEYIINLSPKVPEYLVYDNMRVHQILANLVSNAIKFTPQFGRVRVDIELEKIDNDTAHVSFSVNDTGIGIPIDKQHLVFENFKQASSQTTKEFGGTGLGLSIASQLVEKMGGDAIQLESQEGVGSNFYFSLPLPIGKPGITIKEALKNLSVGLLSEDSAQTAILCNFLDQFGIQYTKDAFESCKTNCQTGKCCYDIYLIQSNFLFNQVIDTFDTSTLYIFFNAPPAVIEHYDNVVRINDFETNNSHLYNLLLDYIVKFSGKKLVNESETFSSRILLVEDNIVNQTLMTALFKKFDITADLAQNGQQAVEMYKKGDYGLVLMDINMPIMGGEEALAELQKYAQQTNLELCPIVALTANVMPEQVKEYKTKGFHSHLAKPLQIQKFKALLDEINQI